MLTIDKHVLSIFPGIDLFGRAFELEGYSVVRGPDPLWGGDVRDFHVPSGVYGGVIGGPPCQDFSKARRCPPTGEGVKMLVEFTRVVTEAFPAWFVMENVPGVPDVAPQGYTMQRFNLNARECGARQNRLRRFQFGYRDRGPVVFFLNKGFISRETQPCAMASEGRRQHRRTWSEFCELQGLPADFRLDHLNLASRYEAVGNGVHINVGRVIAAAIAARCDTPIDSLCVCGCGRLTPGDRTHFDASCRKRMQRLRDSSRVTAARTVTSGPSRDSAIVSDRSSVTRDDAGVTVPGPVTPLTTLFHKGKLPCTMAK